MNSHNFTCTLLGLALAGLAFVVFGCFLVGHAWFVHWWDEALSSKKGFFAVFFIDAFVFLFVDRMHWFSELLCFLLVWPSEITGNGQAHHESLLGNGRFEQWLVHFLVLCCCWVFLCVDLDFRVRWFSGSFIFAGRRVHGYFHGKEVVDTHGFNLSHGEARSWVWFGLFLVLGLFL
jgi:hypothetical protein